MVCEVAGRYKALAIQCRYWKPKDDYTSQIVNAIAHVIDDGDYVTVSEKALSTALGNIVNEKTVKPSLLARFIAKYWMRIAWPHLLAPLCRLKWTTIQFLQSYPAEEGSLHKQVALEHCGFLAALAYGSEGAIDGSNLPHSYVALPLENAQKVAYNIREQIRSSLGKNVSVIIVDTDKTYSWRGFHFTPRPKPVKGIHSVGGFLAYVVGRSLNLKKRATPVAVAGTKISTEDAIQIAKLANRKRGSGSGKTVWDMVQKFDVGLNDVTWEMLDSVKHRPIVVIRPRTQKKK
jgi:F420-0:gamma-glutamyl ligase-like protein